MIRAGLYAEGSDPELDEAIRAWPDLDAFVAETEPGSAQASFDRLGLILRRAGNAPARAMRQVAVSEGSSGTVTAP